MAIAPVAIAIQTAGCAIVPAIMLGGPSKSVLISLDDPASGAPTRTSTARGAAPVAYSPDPGKQPTTGATTVPSGAQASESRKQAATSEQPVSNSPGPSPATSASPTSAPAATPTPAAPPTPAPATPARGSATPAASQPPTPQEGVAVPAVESPVSGNALSDYIEKISGGK
jgi:hypothetical protein